MPDSVSQEHSDGEEVIKDTSKYVFQNTKLDLDALNSLRNSRINSDGLFYRNTPHYSLELILPKDWQKHITKYKEYNRFDFCCFKFRSNTFKKENIRKKNMPFWTGAVECTFEHCSKVIAHCYLCDVG